MAAVSLFSPGCGGHHFSEDGPTGNYRIRDGTTHKRYSGLTKSGYYAEKEVRESCEHEGCNVIRTRWERIEGRVEAQHSKKHDTGHNGVYHRDELVSTNWFSSERAAREILAVEVEADSGVRLSE